MFIQTEQTPNPNTIKFIPGLPVMPDGVLDFADRAAAARSPLAARLFEINGISRVFFGHDFVSVSKDEGREWFILKPAILGAIMEHFTANRPLLLDAASAAAPSAAAAEDDEIVAQIKELLDIRVRPAVAQDGGDIAFERFEDGVVFVRMQGACAGCPSSTATLKSGIETMLRHYVPEVLEVRSI